MPPLRWLLAPPAYVAAALLWPPCVLFAYLHRTWADALDDAALALAGHPTPVHPDLEEDDP